MKDWTVVDVAATGLLGLSVVGGAVYGAVMGGTVLTTIAAAGVFGCFGLLLLIVVGLGAAGVARLLGRRGPR